jgi:hypothetical protein
MKDYTQRGQVKKLLPQWLKKYSKEEALVLLKKGDTIKLISRKDILGLIQALEKL